MKKKPEPLRDKKHKFVHINRYKMVAPSTRKKVGETNTYGFKIKDVESACKFYKYYHNNYELFMKNYPSLVKGKMYCWLNSHNFENEDDRNNEFNCYLFEYTFGDVLGRE